ncbi:hypothetical protein AVEN_33070-1 [Araneus ventricosus]|uniref:Uncharacterized protein n=1 Tax=Araneus ventricosus TaxID=182803 RepID=A0A4Y2CUK0_ARAVE|nr:hypothetical protein AVEN_33070-1 [Araneus ventricosus]
MEDGDGQETIDDISRGNKLSYEINIVKIGPVFGDGGISEDFSLRECTVEMYCFDFSQKRRMVGSGRSLMTYLDVISFHVKYKLRKRSSGWGWGTV